MDRWEANDAFPTTDHTTPRGERSTVKQVQKTIKWRIAAPAYRAAAAAGTVVALVAATGAPNKWA